MRIPSVDLSDDERGMNDPPLIYLFIFFFILTHVGLPLFPLSPSSQSRVSPNSNSLLMQRAKTATSITSEYNQDFQYGTPLVESQYKFVFFFLFHFFFHGFLSHRILSELDKLKITTGFIQGAISAHTKQLSSMRMKISSLEEVQNSKLVDLVKLSTINFLKDIFGKLPGFFSFLS